MNRPSESTDAALGAELLSVIARLNRWSTRNANWTLPTAQARLLAEIDEFGAARIGDLARADHCSQPGMTMQVRRLESAGLVCRVTDPADARAVLISLTERGRELLREIRAARAAAVAPLVGRLTAAERGGLRATLGTLVKLLDAAACEPHDHQAREKH